VAGDHRGGGRASGSRRPAPTFGGRPSPQRPGDHEEGKVRQAAGEVLWFAGKGAQFQIAEDTTEGRGLGRIDGAREGGAGLLPYGNDPG
jgi:hypothetical protein